MRSAGGGSRKGDVMDDDSTSGVPLEMPCGLDFGLLAMAGENRSWN
jgi:hypothetical protein